MTAHAVGGLADSGLVQRLTRGRAWIALLGALLAGIVAANLYALSLSASSARTAASADELARENSVLQSKVSRLLAGGRAAGIGADGSMVVPSPDSINYLRAGSADAARAADRLLGGEIAVAALALIAEALPIGPAVAPEPAAPVTPVETAPTTPVEPTATAPAPAATPESATPAGGVGG